MVDARVGGAAVLAVLVLAGVGADGVAGTRPRWSAVPLAGATAARDVLRCGDGWYLLGAYRGGPGVWRSTDGVTWRRTRTAPHTYYGHRQVLYAGGCHRGRIVAVGAQVGGAHGNPRTSSWYERADGTVVEVPGAVELYGGPRSVGVSRIAGGTTGSVVVGDWDGSSGRVGVAVWWSGDGRGFRRLPDDPALAGVRGEQTTAADATATAGGWLVVGSRYVLDRPRLRREPVAWTSADGRHWRRDRIAASDGRQTLDRVVTTAYGVVAVGVDGSRFAAWRRDRRAWHRIGVFGSADGTSGVRSLAVLPGGGLVTTVPDAGRLALWWSADGVDWARIPVPATVSAHGDTTLVTGATAGTLLVAAHDPHTTRLWYAPIPVS
ncbi:MAG TPA: hypothetical protein VGN37_22845 [Actinocatenispora sp.]